MTTSEIFKSLLKDSHEWVNAGLSFFNLRYYRSLKRLPRVKNPDVTMETNIEKTGKYKKLTNGFWTEATWEKR